MGNRIYNYVIVIYVLKVSITGILSIPDALLDLKLLLYDASDVMYPQYVLHNTDAMTRDIIHPRLREITHLWGHALQT